MAETFQLGVDTFGDVTLSADGQPLSQAQVLRNVVEEAVIAGIKSASTPSASANITALTSRFPPQKSCWPRLPHRTKRILLGSAVTVLSTDEPVRVFQRFSTLDALSNGRAEVILGRRVRSPSPTRSSATTSRTTTSCSRTSFGSSSNCSSPAA